MHFVETVQDILQSRNTTLPVFIDATGSIRHNACSFFVLNTTDEQCVTCHSYRCTLRAIYSKHKAITSPQKETLSITHQSHAGLVRTSLDCGSKVLSKLYVLFQSQGNALA